MGSDYLPPEGRDVTPITFRIPGEPVAWARSGGKGPIRFTPAKQRQFGALVKQVASDALPRGWKFPIGPLRMHVVCVFERPKSKCRKKDQPHLRAWYDGGKDFDNCGKIIADNIQGIVIANDRQIADGHVTKWLGRQGEPPFVLVTLASLPIFVDGKCTFSELRTALGWTEAEEEAALSMT